VLSHAISIAPALTVRALALLLSPALLIAGLTRSLSRTAAFILSTGIVIIGTAVALIGITQKIVLGDHAFGGMRIYGFWQPESLLTTPFGPFVNKNHFAGWMLMAIPVAIGLAASGVANAQSRLRGRGLRSFLVWSSEPEGGRSMLFLLAAAFMTLSLFMTGSRSGMTCLAVVLAALLFAGRRRMSVQMTAVMGVCVALGTAALLQWASADAALQRFGDSSASLASRLNIWRSALGTLRLFPWFGSGLDSFGTLMLVYQPEPRGLRYVEAHNDYLQLLVEGGVLTFVLAIAAIISLVRCIRLRFDAGDDGAEGHWVRVGAAIGLLAIALQSFVEFSLQMPGNTALCAALIAIATYLPAANRPAR
ncbi:MAG: O-antigen ligase family protein, partial [Vicinamibacterales bacterium]